MEDDFLVVEADEGGGVAMLEIALLVPVGVVSPADEGDWGGEVAILAKVSAGFGGGWVSGR